MKKILAWAKKRLTERSTYVGLATIATALGAEKLGVQIGHAGELIAVAIGAGMIGKADQQHAE